MCWLQEAFITGYLLQPRDVLQRNNGDCGGTYIERMRSSRGRARKNRHHRLRLFLEDGLSKIGAQKLRESVDGKHTHPTQQKRFRQGI